MKGPLLPVIILITEVLLLSTQLDAQSLLAQDQGPLTQILGHSALAIQWATALVGAFIVIQLASHQHNGRTQSLASQVNNQLKPLALALHLVIYGLFYWLSAHLFGATLDDPHTINLLALLWLATGLLVGVTWLRLLIPLHGAWTFISDHKPALLISALLATIVTGTSLLAKQLWLAVILPTFIASEWILSWFSDAVFVQPAKLYLGIDDFVVHVSSTCSGIEGVGLSVCFTLLYLYLFRDQLRFPRSLILIPLAALISWWLNVVRIVVLVLLGAHVSPEFAVGGFHSQAGWFTFIALAMGIIFTFNKIRWFKNANHQAKPAAASGLKEDQNSAILVCFLVFLGAALISGLDEVPLNWLYPIKALAGLAAVIYFWRTLKIPTPNKTLEAVALGLVTAVIWVLMIPADPSTNTAIDQALADTPIFWAIVWVAIRLLGSIAVAPIIEELAFRSYLLARISGDSINHQTPVRFHWLGFVLSSLAFGAVHNQWLAGTVAGAIFAVARYRGNLSTAILAHAVTNGVLCLYALGFGQWSYL